MLVPITINQGDSARLVIPITKNGQPVPLSSASDVKLIIETGSGTRLAQYSYIGEEGYGSVSIPLSSEYFLELRIERSESKLFPTGPLYFVIIIQYPDANMPSGLRYETYRYQGLVVRKGSALSEF